MLSGPHPESRPILLSGSTRRRSLMNISELKSKRNPKSRSGLSQDKETRRSERVRAKKKTNGDPKRVKKSEETK